MSSNDLKIGDHKRLAELQRLFVAAEKHPDTIKLSVNYADDKVEISPEACKQCGDWFWYGHTNPFKAKDKKRIVVIKGGKND